MSLACLRNLSNYASLVCKMLKDRGKIVGLLRMLRSKQHNKAVNINLMTVTLHQRAVRQISISKSLSAKWFSANSHGTQKQSVEILTKVFLILFCYQIARFSSRCVDHQSNFYFNVLVLFRITSPQPFAQFQKTFYKRNLRL
jgi:hypothetical protein